MIRPLLAAALLGSMGCAPKPSLEERTVEQTDDKRIRFAPTWEAGDRWRVRYRVLAPNPAKMRDAPPRYEESEFDYAVDKIDGDAVHISAQHEQERWQMVFARDGRLRSMITKYQEPEEPGGDAPFFGLAFLAGERLVKAWPRFPLEQPYGLDDSALTQRTETSDGKMKVTLVRTGDDAGVGVKRTLVMHWEPGRPWWSRVEISAVNTWEGKTYNVAQVQGEVIAWPPSTP